MISDNCHQISNYIWVIKLKSASFPSSRIPTKPMFLQSFNVISHKCKLVAPKMVEIVPRINTSLMQVIKIEPGPANSRIMHHSLVQMGYKIWTPKFRSNSKACCSNTSPHSFPLVLQT